MLILLPNLLCSKGDHRLFLPQAVDETMCLLDGLIAESDKGGRSYLKRFKLKQKPHLMPLALLPKHPTKGDIAFLLEPMKKGEVWGFVSDAGLPCLADPGALLVFNAKRLGIEVKALSGPSALTHALMLSGLYSQQFCFRGYISKHPEMRDREIREWERESSKTGMVQLFIETPYRNQHTFEALLKQLNPKTLLSVCVNLTFPEEYVETTSIEKWRKKEVLSLHKRPVIFLFSAGSIGEQAHPKEKVRRKKKGGGRAS